MLIAGAVLLAAESTWLAGLILTEPKPQSTSILDSIGPDYGRGPAESAFQAIMSGVWLVIVGSSAVMTPIVVGFMSKGLTDTKLAKFSAG